MEYIEISGRKYPSVTRSWADVKEGKIPHVLCPFCNHYHDHGIGDDPQHVHSHCTDGSYYGHVIADDGTLMYKERGYIIVDFNKPSQ